MLPGLFVVIRRRHGCYKTISVFGGVEAVKVSTAVAYIGLIVFRAAFRKDNKNVLAMNVVCRNEFAAVALKRDVRNRRQALASAI